MKRTALIPILPFLLLSTAVAEPVTVSFEATVNYLQDPKEIFAGKLEVGSVITGKYTYDPAQPDSNPGSEVGDYEFSAAPYGVSINIANVLVGTKPGGYFLIETVNDYNGTDNFLFQSHENNASDRALSIDHIGWQLDDPTQTALSSDALTAGPPPIDKFESWFGLEITEATESGFYLNAEVTKVATGDRLFRPIISILPASGQLLDTQKFEPAVKVDAPATREPSIEKILLNGNDVTRRFLKHAHEGIVNGAAPGKTWSFKGLELPPGTHVLQTDLRFDDGSTSSAVVNWEVLDTCGED